jgi:multidrug efflux pump subunit AcrA (membrane-fusion protein)
MVRKYGLPLLAIAGVSFALFMIWWSSRTPPVASILFPPSESPYKHYIAGVGLIESAGRNIEIGVPFPELITDVYVHVGDILHAGDPLFQLDIRKLNADLAKAEEELALALTEYENRKTQYSFYERLKDKAAVSERAYQESFYLMKEAAERVKIAQASINVIKTNIERSTIRAPIDGQVLQMDIRVGEFANVNPFNQRPLMVFGEIDTYHVRVDIDEEDAWRLIPGTPATAYVRSNNAIEIPLEFAYLEPYMVPKTSLSGLNTERVDTRVLQVVYRFKKQNYPVYIGQLLDVFVEAKPHEVKR